MLENSVWARLWVWNRWIQKSRAQFSETENFRAVFKNRLRILSITNGGTDQVRNTMKDEAC